MSDAIGRGVTARVASIKQSAEQAPVVHTSRVAYDGCPHHGFQRQLDVPTAKDVTLDTCYAFSVCDDDREPTDCTATGQIDAGASALAQTVTLEYPG